MDVIAQMRGLGRCTRHDAFDPDCVWCCEAERQLVQATGVKTLQVFAHHHRGAVEDRNEMATLLTEAVRSDYGTPGWRARAIKAGCLTAADGGESDG